MTAAVIMLLAQESKLRFNDPISKYIPSVPNGDTITIAQLLEMRSGLYNYTSDPIISKTIDSEPAKVWTPAELLAIAFAHPPNFPPGKEYECNNTNYALLGLVAEKVDGKPLAQIMHDRLFGPQNMQQTELPPSTVNTIPPNRTRTGTSTAAPRSHWWANRLTRPKFRLRHELAPPAKGLYGREPFQRRGRWRCHLDRQRLRYVDQALVGGKVFNADYQRRWFDSLQPEDPSKPRGQKYGYGLAQLSWGPNTIYFHGGEMPVFNSKISYDPANDMTLIVWTNLTVSLDDQQTANTLWVKVLDQIYVVSPLR